MESCTGHDLPILSSTVTSGIPFGWFLEQAVIAHDSSDNFNVTFWSFCRLPGHFVSPDKRSGVLLAAQLSKIGATARRPAIDQFLCFVWLTRSLGDSSSCRSDCPCFVMRRLPGC